MIKKHQKIADSHVAACDAFRRAWKKSDHVEKIQIAEDFLEDVVDMMSDYLDLADEYKELAGALEEHK